MRVPVAGPVTQAGPMTGPAAEKRWRGASEAQTHADLGAAIQGTGAGIVVEVGAQLTQAQVAIHVGGEGVAGAQPDLVAIVEVTAGDHAGGVEAVAAQGDLGQVGQVDIAIATQPQAAALAVIGVVLGPASPDAHLAVTGMVGAHQLSVEDGSLLARSEEHTSELQSRPHLVCRLLLEKKKQ